MPKTEVNNQNQAPVNPGAVLDADEWYDLLPIEKKLITYSLVIGVTLLVIFIVIFRVLK